MTNSNITPESIAKLIIREFELSIDDDIDFAIDEFIDSNPEYYFDDTDDDADAISNITSRDDFASIIRAYLT